MRKKDAATDVGSEWSAAAPVAPAAPAGRVTPAEVQEKEFHVTRVGSGYRMREVDEFLDQVTDTLTALIAENDRLRGTAAPERAAIPSTSRPTAAHPEDGAAVDAFLRREKGFLQDLGGLVQAHAEELRSMVRTVRRDAVPPAATSTAPAAEPVEAAAPRSAVAEETAAATEPAPSGTIEPPPAEAAQEHEGTPATSVDVDPAAPMTITDAGGDEPILLEEPEPARSRRSEDEEGNSLRELFWGEE